MDTAARGWIGQLIFLPPFELGEHIGLHDNIGVGAAFGFTESSAHPPKFDVARPQQLRFDNVSCLGLLKIIVTRAGNLC